MPMQVAEEISLSEARIKLRRETYNVEAIAIIVSHYMTCRKKGSLVVARVEKKSRGSVMDNGCMPAKA